VNRFKKQSLRLQIQNLRQELAMLKNGSQALQKPNSLLPEKEEGRESGA